MGINLLKSNVGIFALILAPVKRKYINQNVPGRENDNFETLEGPRTSDV